MRPAIFLDRDGVLNARRLGLVRRASQLRLLPGIADAASRLTRAGFALIIVTNQDFVGQRWIGGTYIRREDHEDVMERVVEALEAEGGAVDGVYACTHPRTVECACRKPRPGMLLDAAREHALDLHASYMIGDNAKDMLAGRAARCRTVLVDPRLRTRLQHAAKHADHVARDLPQATEWILHQPVPAPPSATKHREPANPR